SFTENLQYFHQKGQINFYERLDSVVIQYDQNGRSIPQKAWVKYLDQWRHPMWEDSLQLPLVLPLRGTFSHIQVNVNKQIQTYDFGESMLLIGGQRSRDSLIIQTQNPRKIQIWYSLFRGNKLIEQGRTDSLNFSRAINERQYYFLSTRYLWKGRVISQDFRFRWYPNQVNLKVEQPAQVAPGSLVPIKITVRDVDQQPIADFDLALYAYTAKFQQPKAPRIPVYAPQWENRIAGPNFFANSNFDREYRNRLLDYPLWAAKAGLDTLAWYHFRYPSGERYQYSFAIEDTNLAQFAPYVFDKGLQCNPIIIYLDDRPVFYQNQAKSPFSFRSREGFHNIKIRLHDRVIQMDSVWLEAGKKTIISVDKTKLGPHTTWRSAKPELGEIEWRTIQQYFVEFRFPAMGKVIVSQGLTLHYLSQSGAQRNQLLGPFTDNLPIKIQGEGWNYEIPKKRGYSYKVFPRYAQLTSQPLSNHQKTYLQPYKSEPYEISALRRIPPEVSFQTRKITQSEALWRLIPRNNPMESCFWQATLTDSLQRKVAYTFLEGKDKSSQRIYPGYNSDFQALPIGAYRLTYLFGKPDSIYGYFRTPYQKLRNKGINFNAWDTFDLLDIPDSLLKRFKADLKQAEQIGRILLSDSDSVATAFLREQFPDPVKLNFPENWTQKVSGVVLDSKEGRPLVGVTVSIRDSKEGIAYGVLTDQNGRFTINVKGASTQLWFSYLGFTSQMQTASWLGEREIYLVENYGSLEEVVVVGYGSRAAQDFSHVPVYVDGVQAGSLVGKVAGVSFEGSLKSMPGVATNDEFSDSPQSVKFGNAGLNEETDQIPIPYGDQSASSLRSNFRDYAFWYPNLKTGAEGTVEIKARIPDDITRWDLFAVGHNDQRQIGKTTSQMQAYRMLSGQIVLPRFLLPGDSLRLIGKSINYTGDTLDIETDFSMDELSVLRSSHTMTNVVLDTAQFRVPRSGKDSLQFRYQLTRTADGYQDGEQRMIPIYQPGIEETKGEFWAMWQDTSITFRADSSLGPLFVNVEADLLSSLRTELRRLRAYPHECNEQAASKLLALLYQRKIKEQLGENFRGNNEIRRLIRKLIKNQNEDTSWGWWPNLQGQMWVSLHVVEALMLAREEGFYVDFREEDIKARLLFEWESFALLDQYRALDLLSQLDAKLNYQGVLDSLLTLSYGHSRYLTENYLLRQRYELPMEMDSLLMLRKQTQLGSYFWGEEAYRVTNNAFLTSIRVFELLRAEEKFQREAALTLNYLLAGREPYYWRNTYESASALAVILPDLIDAQGEDLRPQIWVNGKQIEDFPFRDTLAANAQLELRFEGRLPVYATAYQRYWNEKPQASQEPFAIRTYFLDAQNDTLTRLKGGEKVRLVAELELESSAEYVAVRLPIPAGCSYANKRLWWRAESYRAYKREQTEIYCLKLPAGTHRFEVSLMPRFAGEFNLRTTRAEMMYFPLFFGQNEQKLVEIR
ncbi:MAG: carboxypeptidase regulatory-like domain-containing protein, partial [Bacteroidota bacterium]